MQTVALSQHLAFGKPSGWVSRAMFVQKIKNDLLKCFNINALTWLSEIFKRNFLSSLFFPQSKITFHKLPRHKAKRNIKETWLKLKPFWSSISKASHFVESYIDKLSEAMTSKTYRWNKRNYRKLHIPFKPNVVTNFYQHCKVEFSRIWLKYLPFVLRFHSNFRSLRLTKCRFEIN